MIHRLFLLASRNVEEHSRDTRGSSTVNTVEALAVELDDVANLKLGDIAIRDSAIPELGVVVEDILQLIILAQGVLLQQIVKVNQLNGDQILALGGQPGNLLLGLLDITAGVQLKIKTSDSAIGISGNLADESVAPVHQRDLLILLEQLDVFLLEENIVAESDSLHTDSSVLGMLGLLLGVRASRAIGDNSLDVVLANDSSVARCNGVNVLLVGSPD